jgi:hypothetical protein
MIANNRYLSHGFGSDDTSKSKFFELCHLHSRVVICKYINKDSDIALFGLLNENNEIT